MEQLIHVPEGHVLEQVGPGLFAVRPVAAAAPAPAAPAAPAPAAAPAKKRAPSVLFRERQKGLISDLEQQVLSKLEELRLLGEENRALKKKTSVLQRAVDGRDVQIDIIRTLGGSSTAGSGAGDSSSGGAAPAGSGSGDGGSSSGAAAGGAGSHGAAETADSAAACNGGGPGAGAASASPPWRNGAGDTDAPCWGRLKAAPDAAAYVKHMSLQDARALWREYISLLEPLAAALESEGGAAATACAPLGAGAGSGGSSGGQGDQEGIVGGGGGSAAAGTGPEEEHEFLFYGSARLPEGYGPPGSARARIYTLVNRYMGALRHMYILNPCAVDPLIGMNLQTGGAQQVPCSFWRGVVAKLRFTQEQVEDIVAMHDLYMRHITGILSERGQLQARVGRGESLSAEMATAQQLSANFGKELALRLLLHSFCFNHVLTPLQLARAALHSSPLFPDLYAVMTLTVKIASEERETATGADTRQPLFAPGSGPPKP